MALDFTEPSDQRKAISFSLKPEAIETIKRLAAYYGVSRSRLVEQLVMQRTSDLLTKADMALQGREE